LNFIHAIDAAHILATTEDIEVSYSSTTAAAFESQKNGAHPSL